MTGRGTPGRERRLLCERSSERGSFNKRERKDQCGTGDKDKDFRERGSRLPAKVPRRKASERE